MSRVMSPVAADALVRIPSVYFRDMAWAQDAIAKSLSMVNDALAGDRARTLAWVRDVVAAPDCVALLSVFAAVCDAIVAEAFREKNDTLRISNFMNALEHEVYTELAAQSEEKDRNDMNDSDTAELAAGLVRVVQMHDRDTAVHLDATGALARRIAIAMDLPADQVLTIELAARLHDIGKVGVRKEVLCKPAALTDDEWREMRSHSEVGAEVLVDTPKLAHLAPIVRAHHERIDGAGYPDRLRGDEIPLEARVIAVADAFHAMTTERSYRHAIMPSDALEVLAQHAGTQFDADVVEATIEMFHYVRRSQRAIA